jgi:hypothetical protein
MQSRTNHPILKFLFRIAQGGMVLWICFGLSGAPAARALEAGTVAPARTTLLFSGREWVARDWTGGPGGETRQWSDSPSSVWVDANGLHLKIRQENNTWYSAEVDSVAATQYGTHCFYVDGRVDLLDKNIVLGLFLYKDDQHEIDIEFARWGDESYPNSQYVVQPSTAGGEDIYLFEFNTSLSGAYSTHCFNWQPGYVEFWSTHGHYSWPPGPDYQIEHRQTPVGQYIPPSDGSYKIMLNLWLLSDSTQPSNGQSAEITIKDIDYPAIPTNTLSVNVAGTGSGTVTGTGISCPGDCTETYDDGTPVTLTAHPAPGSAFTGWSGACDGMGACIVTMTGARAVTASFALTPFRYFLPMVKR